MKIITVCGSLKYKNEVLDCAFKLQLKGNVVMTPIFPENIENYNLSESDYEMLKQIHKEKIKLSDAIYVVNVDGYIGNSTKKEIEYASSLNKKIIYLEGNKAL